MDINYLRKKISRIVNQKHLILIYLGADEVFIPIKVREPKVARDRCYGFLNINFISSVEKKYLVLKNGDRIDFLDSRRTIVRRIKMAKRLEKNFYNKTWNMPEADDKELVFVTKDHVVIVIKK